ncbi:MAG: TonB-dependent receptor [Bacteroidetes bacterium]|nr:TonB-dependent receptor [Bacteroidota bacterium]
MFPTLVIAQEVKGYVLEVSANDTLPLPGVNVYWAGSQTGTITDSKGFFSIKPIPRAQHLVFSFVGYTNDTLKVKAGDRVKHIMRNALELSEVEVTGRAQTQFVSRMSTTNTVKITSGELQRAACCNLSESFETSASVNVNYSDAVTGAKQIEMLGLAGIYTQMMSENVPGMRGLASSFGLLYVPGSWMESIQVSKGTSSVLNGFESITGQINVEYKKPHDSERFFLNLFQDHTGRSELNTNFKFKVTDRLSTMMLGHLSHNGRSHDGNHDGFLDEPLYTQINLFNRWDYRAEHFEFQFGVRAISETRKGGQEAFNHSMPATVQPGIYGIGINNDRLESFLKTGFIFHRPSTSLGIQQQLTWHRLHADFGPRFYHAEEKSYYLNALFQSFIRDTRHNYTTGFSLMYDQLSGSSEAGSENQRHITPGVFYQYTYSDGARLNLIAGIRADHEAAHGIFVTPRLHLRYNASEHTILRLSAGKGYRRPRLLAENLSLMASYKPFVFIGMTPEQSGMLEQAWNFGFNISQYVHIAGREMVINLDAYRTSFVNQLVVDRLSASDKVQVYQLDGRSFSNSFQLEANYDILPTLNATAAFRLNDVKVEYLSGLQEKPLLSKYKGLLSFSYKPNARWQFDLTGLLNGPSVLPRWAVQPDPDLGNPRSPVFFTANSQLTRNFRKWSFYLGGENLTNYKQHHPILSSSDPFDPAFDASVIWGPLMGTKIYAGLRYTLE